MRVEGLEKHTTVVFADLQEGLYPQNILVGEPVVAVRERRDEGRRRSPTKALGESTAREKVLSPRPLDLWPEWLRDPAEHRGIGGDTLAWQLVGGPEHVAIRMANARKTHGKRMANA